MTTDAWLDREMPGLRARTGTAREAIARDVSNIPEAERAALCAELGAMGARPRKLECVPGLREDLRGELRKIVTRETLRPPKAAKVPNSLAAYRMLQGGKLVDYYGDHESLSALRSENVTITVDNRGVTLPRVVLDRLLAEMDAEAEIAAL